MIRDPSQNIKIIYVLQPPVDTPFGTLVKIAGEVVANPDGQRFSLPVPAVGLLKISPFHWADMNGNSVIDDLEILDVSDMVDATEQIHYDWDLIEEMWDAGGYLYDEGKHTFVPGKAEIKPEK
jgi:hypothetical protein